MTTRLIFQNIFRFLILMAFQLLVLEKINLGGFVVPYVYLLFIMMLPTNTGRIPMLIIAFCTGLIMDAFCNMLGFHAFACTMMAFCRILFADRILVRNDHADISSPNFYVVSFRQFAFYVTLLLFIFYIFFFSLEVFSIHGFGRVLLSSIGSTLVTGGLIMLLQLLFIRKKK